MRKVKQLLVIAGLFVFAASFTAQAQDTDVLKSEAKKELDKEKDKVKDKVKDKDKAKDKVKEKKDAMKDDAKDKTGQVKGDATSFTDLQNEKIKVLEEKLKKARTDKERQEIKEMIAQEMKSGKKDAEGKVDDAKSDFTTNVNDAKNDANDKVDAATKEDGSTASQNDGNGIANDNVVIKATELGIAKRDDAKAKLAQKEKDLVGKEELVKNGRARIASAKERLAAAIASGELTEDQIKEKQAKIDRAEAGIDKLEKSINGGKAAYARQKTSLSKLYDNQ